MYSGRSAVIEGVEILVQWIPAFAGMTGEKAGIRALRISCWYLLFTITKRVYVYRARRVSQDGASPAVSGRSVHLFWIVVLSGAVGGQDDL
jgi:hypothetical protein